MNSYTPEEPIEIVLIEDNPGDVRLTQEAFNSVESDVTFQVVTNGVEAGRYFSELDGSDPDDHPDLVLLDLNLPRSDGFDVLDILAEEIEYPPPPVLILSSSESKADIIKSYEKAANAYLTKPQSPTEFDSMAQAIESFWIDTAQHAPVEACA
ncbi:response regulator [Natronosalvus vescus]|uniref:response regulator n=1 Tax=Natronosalvus vescus TaxID=2953881 RepID=UPI0020919E2A|nr:response regulator [Natronosalvus vescus]